MRLDPQTAKGALEGSHRAPVGRSYLGDDGEPEPAATRIPGPRLVEADEPLEDPFAFRMRDPFAVIVDAQHDLAVGCP